MKMRVIFTVALLLCLLSACAAAPETPTTTQPETTTQSTTTDTTAVPDDGVFTLSDLQLDNWPSGGITSPPLISFIYDADENYLIWGDLVAQSVANAGLEEGYLYQVNRENGNIIMILSEPVLAQCPIEKYIFCVTAENKLIVTDDYGTFCYVLYEAHTKIQPESLGYWKRSLYFVDGDQIINLDLISGVPTVLFEYPGAVEADPLYGIDDQFPHLLCIRTETEDVACNLETGETAVIPETGQWGTAAFDLFWGQGIWPEEDAES